ncbi:MAG TPA: nickel-dependent hydrogenase large subunit [Casimicrobiaceae bacterium]|nr:nickel-dependent hydrogenase large subunit [Casimicrobiaceae bacterium]
MTLEGEVLVRLRLDGERVARAEVTSLRPLAPTRWLAGRSPEAVLAAVPAAFSVCGVAQGAAAARALACAGHAGAVVDDAAVMYEIVQEHFFRLLIGAPQALGRGVDLPAVAAARRRAEERSGAAIAQTAAETLFGMPASEWLALEDADALQAWAERGATLPALVLADVLREMPDVGRSDVPLLTEAAPEAIARGVVPNLVRDSAFAQQPTWNGAAAETGPLARMRAHPLVAALLARDGNTVAARFVARLAELATLVLALRDEEGSAGRWVAGCGLSDGSGLGAVQTARGLLLHRARIEGGRVIEYQIVAPTEWNFHPDGALARGLVDMQAEDVASLERKARLAVQLLDPCVASRIEVGHA